RLHRWDRGSRTNQPPKFIKRPARWVFTSDFVSPFERGRMGHDQLFKAVLERLLQGFLELFFPEFAARCDFETLRFVDKEVFANVPEGEVREADVVARLETREGEPEIVLVHIEVQARPEADFARRMFEYYALLRIHHRLPVFPVVLYLRGGPASTVAEYREDLFGQEQLRFRYRSVALARLSAEEYVGASPLGAALAALMRRGKTRDGLELRREMLSRVLESELDDARKYLLVNVIETYFRLSGEEAARFRRLISEKEYRKMHEVELTYFDELELKGVLKGKRETLLRLLTAKFGPLPEDTVARIAGISSALELDTYLDRVLTANSLQEIGLGQ
ncbi:MAG: Rpn family recombination-promoting nuclease/putative transposase, partial [Vicinamibacteria bacterium]